MANHLLGYLGAATAHGREVRGKGTLRPFQILRATKNDWTWQHWVAPTDEPVATGEIILLAGVANIGEIRIAHGTHPYEVTDTNYFPLFARDSMQLHGMNLQDLRLLFTTNQDTLHLAYTQE